MKRECIEADPQGRLSSDFSLWDIAGSWLSIENSTELRVYRNRERKNGSVLVELVYATGAACRRRPFRAFGIWYIKLFGLVGIAYDGERDLLFLTDYGFYKRVF